MYGHAQARTHARMHTCTHARTYICKGKRALDGLCGEAVERRSGKMARMHSIADLQNILVIARIVRLLLPGHFSLLAN